MTNPGVRAASDSDEAFLHAMGTRLRMLRAQRGMTRRILSQQSGVSERYIAQVEAGAGNVSVLLLRAIAGALGVAIAELIAEQASRSPEFALLESFLARLPEIQLREAREILLARFGAVQTAMRDERIALIGLRGAGKSSLGKLLAARRGVPFHELDREIEREAGMELSEIFAIHGQTGFRRLERSALERLLTVQGGAVIAAGGSIVAEPATYEMLLRNCFTVWIRAAPEEHMRRVIDQGDLRPMQDSGQAMADLRAILASREYLYARADAVLDTSGRALEASLKELARITPAKARE